MFTYLGLKELPFLEAFDNYLTNLRKIKAKKEKKNESVWRHDFFLQKIILKKIKTTNIFNRIITILPKDRSFSRNRVNP